MGPTSRTLSLALGVLLAMAAATESSARALMQEPTGASVGNQDQQATPPDQKPDDKVAPVQATDKPGQAIGSGQPAVASSGQDQKGKATGNESSARNPKKAVSKVKSKPQKEPQQVATKTPATGPSSIHNAAVQILNSLDAAISVVQKSETLDPSSSSGKQANDISARRKELQQKAKSAKDDNAWADVAAGAATDLADALKLTEANPANHGASVQAGSDQTGANHAAAPRAEDREFFRSPQLPLYVAGLSLVLSVLGLGSGWLLARREINKALIEAGLL